MTAKRICVVLTTRGNLAKMKSTMAAIAGHPDLALQTVIGGALIDQEYGVAIAGETFGVDGTLDYIAGDRTPQGIAQSAGRCTIEMSRVLAQLQPDILIVIADRYEALAMAQAALCQNVIIAHLEGGEVSGSIDERIRHAVAKLAHLHFPANQDAAQRLARLGEIAANIHVVGTPSLDLLREFDIDDKAAVTATLAAHGRNAALDLAQRYIVVSQHPVATQYAQLPRQIDATLEAVRTIALPAVWVLPNDEAGSPDIVQRIAGLEEAGEMPPIRYLSSLSFVDYAVMIRHACCLIGNTSSGLREGAYLGVPVVNIGSRQYGRARGANVVDVGHDAGAITNAARRQIAKRRYPRDTLYGDGCSGQKIAQILARPSPPLDKTIAY